MLHFLMTCIISINIDRLILKKSKESDQDKSSRTIIETEIPWSDNEGKPRHHDDKSKIKKQHLKVTASSLGLPSRDHAPSSSFSTMASGASTQMAFSSHSMVLVSPSVQASSISIAGLPKSISPSLAPTMPAKRRFPPPPPKVPPTKATINTVTREPRSHEMQHEDDVPSRHTRGTDHNITITAASWKQRGTSSESPSKHVTDVNMFELNAPGPMVDRFTSTEDIQPHTLSGKRYFLCQLQLVYGGLLSAFDSEASGPVSSPARGILSYVLTRQDTLLSQCLSPTRCLKWVPMNLMLGAALRCTSITSEGGGGGRGWKHS